MSIFFFNECFPKEINAFEALQTLGNSLIEFNILKKEYEDIEGIVLPRTPDDISILEGYSLKSCISELSSKELRTIAYSEFIKYPTEAFFEIKDDDNLLNNEYKILINGIKHEGINQVIAYENGAILFSLGLHDDLRVNLLTIHSKDGNNIVVSNFFGREDNTNYIKSLFDASIISSLDNLGKLKSIIPNVIMHKKFISNFNKLSNEIQDSVIENFQTAIGRGLVTPLAPDNVLVKEVSPEGTTFNVCELRIFNPVAFRVYYYEDSDTTFLCNIEKKPMKKKQTIHINNAVAMIKQFLQIGP